MINQSDWDNIDSVLLDMDGTLLDLHFDNHFWLEHMPAHFARSQGLSLEAAKHQLAPIFATEYGKLHWYSIDFWNEQTGLDIAGLKHDVRHLIQYRPLAEKFLKALRVAGKDILLVTNADRRSVAIKIAETGLDHYLDAIHCSHDFGAAKEDPDFWPRLEQATGIDRAKSLFLDDTVPVLEAARGFGIGYVFAIEQPDSKRVRQLQTDFPIVASFQQIMPAGVASDE